MAKAGIQFSSRDEWYSPKWVVDFFGPFDYDPATTEERARLFGIPHFDTVETDGLKRDWSGYKRIWVNPPFSRKFEFLEKAVDTVKASVNQIFFLFPADSMITKKFYDITSEMGYTVYLPNKRIGFEGNEKASSPAFGSVVIEFNGGEEKRIKAWRLDD